MTYVSPSSLIALLVLYPLNLAGVLLGPVLLDELARVHVMGLFVVPIMLLAH
jgi:hypothetical protein